MSGAQRIVSKHDRSKRKSVEAGSQVAGSPEVYSPDAAREYAKRWAETGPALEELRFRQLQELDDETARKMMSDLFDMWRPGASDDQGAGMVEQQRIFSKLRLRESGGDTGQ